MKLISSPKILLTIAALSVSAAASSAQAALLAYEGFDYGPVSGGQLPGSANTGTGFSSGWQVAAGGSAVPWTYQASSMAFSSNFQTSGGSSAFASNGGDIGNLYRPLSAGVSGTTFGSFVFNIGSRQNAVVDVMFGAAGATDNTATSVMAASEWGQANSGVRIADTNGTHVQTLSGEPLALGTTYMYLWKSEMEASSQKTTAWILTSAQYDYFSSNGFSEAALNSAGTGTGANNVFQTGSLALTGSLGDLSTMHLFGYGWEPVVSAQIDEIRVGTSISDVTPVPEPATAALLGVGAVLSLRLARRVRRDS